jgi:hypothetical protein
MADFTIHQVMFSGIPSLKLTLSTHAEVIVNLEKPDGTPVSFEDDGNQFMVKNGPINYIFMPEMGNYGGFTVTYDAPGQEVVLLNVYEAPDEFIEGVRAVLANHLQVPQFAQAAAAAGGKRSDKRRRRATRKNRRSRSSHTPK